MSCALLEAAPTLKVSGLVRELGWTKRPRIRPSVGEGKLADDHRKILIAFLTEGEFFICKGKVMIEKWLQGAQKCQRLKGWGV